MPCHWHDNTVDIFIKMDSNDESSKYSLVRLEAQLVYITPRLTFSLSFSYIFQANSFQLQSITHSVTLMQKLHGRRLAIGGQSAASACQ